MGIRFAAVPKSHVAKTPNYIGAAGLDQKQRLQAEALRTKQIGGGINLYNTAMGEDSPIYDSIFPESSVNTEATELGDMDLTALEDGGATAAPQSELATSNMTPYVEEGGASSLTTMADPTAAQMVNPVAEQAMFSDMAQEEMLTQMAAEEAAMAGLAETAVTDVAADAAITAGAESALGSAVASGGGNPWLTAALMANNYFDIV